MSAAYRIGYTAYQQGKPLFTGNPYRPDSLPYKEWMMGWRSAQADGKLQ
jgi:hypothetical protein